MEQNYNYNTFRYISIDDFSFVSEVSKMIATMIEVKGIRIDEFWLVYMYADKLQSYINRFKSTTPTSFPSDRNHPNGMIQLYAFVVGILDEYLKLNCNHKNTFNMNFADCFHSNRPTNNLIPIFKCTHCLPVAAKIIQNNKQAFSLIMLHNLNVGLFAYESKMIIDGCYLVHVLSCSVLTSYIDAFGKYFDTAEWHITESRILNRQYYTSHNELKKIINQRILYYELIAIYKISMLQLTWKFIVEIYNLIAESKSDSYINRYIVDWNSILIQFNNALYLSDDDFFQELCTFFNSQLNYYFKNVDSIIEKIQYEHDSISASIGTSSMTSMISNYSTVGSSYNLIDQHLTDAQQIVNEILNNTSLGWVDFKLIQSYMKCLDDIDKRLHLGASCGKTLAIYNLATINLS
ncbi:uncharacterized protein LOC126846255 [Adelges cooleyi]|uniref:uncharacterized protein LOC126846255 n=1 Tax=Adelges cooleyi TaxID=133065 RepID=UPI00217F408B|nr:uncharacterized protein LOC126846255 [Adelges cooleyi]